MNEIQKIASMAQGATEATVDVVATVAAQDSTAKVSYTPAGLAQYAIYSSTYLNENGYERALFLCNRNLNPKNKTSKKRSLMITKGPVSPSLIISARAALSQNLTIINDSGDVIDENYPNLDMVYVIGDGQHRDLSIIEMRDSGDEKSKNIENFYYTPLNSECSIVDMLQQANVTVSCWDNIDTVSSVLMTRSGSGIDMSKIEWIKEKSKFGSSTAAYRWAELKTVRIPTKQKLSKAATDDGVFKEVAHLGNFKYGSRLYDSMARTFSSSFLGLKVVPETFIDFIEESVKGSRTYDEVIDYIDRFITTFSRSLADEMEKFKTEKGVQTKDQKIASKFKMLFEEYQKNNPVK